MTHLERQRSTAGGMLAARLFVPGERWGWEYRAAQSTAFDPGPEPQWVEPPPPDLGEPVAGHTQAREQLPKRIAITGAVLLIGMFAGSGVIVLVGLLAGGAWAALPLLLATRRIRQTNLAWQEQRGAQHDAYLLHCSHRADWIARYRDEEARSAAAPPFHPLTVESAASRVDVFGDDCDGWASLLTTVGCSMLQSDTEIVLLDLSGEHVAGALIELATACGFAPTHVRLPAEADRIPLLHGLSAHEASEVLAEVARGPWQKAEQPDHRALHAELIRTVAEQLDGPLTIPTIAAGLRVLRRTYNPGVETVLTEAEIDRITDHVDGLGPAERVQAELHALSTTLTDLCSGLPGTGTAPPAARRTALTVLESATDHRRKKAVDRLLFHRTLHNVSAGDLGAGTVLVVAGAKSLDLESMDTLARQARRAGVRLVLLIEELRDELTRLLGRSNSATIFMRLGNTEDALHAAEHIGKGHRFVVSQVTEQIGNSFTQGDSEAVGTQTGESVGTTNTSGTTTSEGTSRGASQQAGGLGGSLGGNPITRNAGTNSSTSSSMSRADSVTRSRSETWQRTVNWSNSLSDSTSTTTARSYDFEREPAEFKNLARTAFILVEPAPSGRRVVMGDCNPGISLLPPTATQGG